MFKQPSKYIGLLKSLNPDPELDYFEYPTDTLARAAYVTNDTGSVTQSNIELTGQDTYDGFGYDGVGQSFKVSTTNVIPKFTFQLKKSAGATGTLTGYIYSDDGTGLPNTVLATFSSIAMSAITTDLADYDWTGIFTPTANTQYHAVIIWTGATAGDHFYISTDNPNDPYADGTCVYHYTTAPPYWRATTYDLYFKIYQVINLQCSSEPTIKTQGNNSLKVEAAITGSLNKTLTRTVSPPINCSGMNSWKTDVRALRLGSNFKITLRNSNAATIERTPNVAEASVFQTEDADLSTVADADKNAIDQIKIEILDATEANTFYLDNMFAEYVPTAVAYRAQKGLVSGFHCFVKQYIDFTKLGLAPLKLPDGTLW